MRVLVFADLQADEGAERLRSDPSIPLQRWRVQRFYQWAANLVQSHKIDAVWDLGDTTNDRTALLHPTVQAVTRGCAALTAGLPALHNFKLIGNHEQYSKGGQTHVGSLFHPYFNVIQDRSVFTLPNDRLHVVCASFPSDYNDLETWLDKTLSTLADRDRAQTMRIVVLGHFMVLGATIAQHGIGWGTLKHADCVLLGHVHRRQKLPGKCSWYIGSPFQQDFGEANDPEKCVAILDTDTLAVEWVPTPFPTYRTVSVAELAAAARSNDVLKVMVRSSDEAQRLYASPLAHTVQPVYAFSQPAPETQITGSESPLSLDFTHLTRTYAQAVALPGSTPDELLEVAREFQ